MGREVIMADQMSVEFGMPNSGMLVVMVPHPKLYVLFTTAMNSGVWKRSMSRTATRSDRAWMNRAENRGGLVGELALLYALQVLLLCALCR